ncbi:hypothetical protein GCM10022221_44010 [Actinocorallia aurea]
MPGRRRLSREVPAEDYLAALKSQLAVGVPVIIEVALHLSVGRSFKDGVIPRPHPRERLLGDHVALLVGYDENVNCGHERTGAFRVRNSWGCTWGEDGYGWLPFDHVREGWAFDSWIAVDSDWRM